jgi:stage III sporulation protein AG
MPLDERAPFNILEGLKRRIERLGPSQRYIWVLLIAIGMGLLLIWGGDLADPKRSVHITPSVVRDERALQRYEASWSETQWERELSQALSHIRGAGVVRVDLTLEGTDLQIWQEREESETRQLKEEGTSRREERQTRLNRDLVFTQRNGVETPVLQQKRRPGVVGVLVIAEGADHPVVREELTKAVAVATNAKLHRITVLPGK